MKKIIFAAFCASILRSLRNRSISMEKTDKNPVLYQVGEPMVFTIALRDKDAENEIAKGHRITWTRLGDDGRTEKGNAVSDQPLIITTKSEKPGFVWIKVNILDENGNPRKGIYENSPEVQEQRSISSRQIRCPMISTHSGMPKSKNCTQLHTQKRSRKLHPGTPQ